MLQACLNGARRRAEHPSLPESASEIARDAVAARDAGATALHVHPRNAIGAESLEPDVVGECLDAVRAAVPGMPVGVGTGTWIAPGGRARLALIERWTVPPDYASVNLGEADHADTMERLHALGVGVEAGLWNRQDAERFAALPDASRCLRVLVEMTDDDPAAAAAECREVLGVLASNAIRLPLLLHGEGGSVWEMVRLAARLGLSTRVGFEDGPALPDGTIASSNADLVRAARAIGGDFEPGSADRSSDTDFTP